jgi:ubiquitin-protein ligase
MKLLVSEFEVIMASETSTSEFLVKFEGPKDSPYEGVSIAKEDFQ